jgi:SAM-dependent methyltransferase
VNHPFSGDGPGVQTPDGCSVELYRQLPYMGELDEVIERFAEGTSVLELGCGTGRLCAHLASAGCLVTGVDESADMLASLPRGVEAVQSSIEDLELGRTFDTVLLASHLINHPSAHMRRAFARCARRHLNVGGLFVLMRHSPDWLKSVQVGPVGLAQGVAMHVEAVSREANLVHMTLRYQLANQVWRQSFSTVSLSEAEVEELLVSAGFSEVRWQGRQRLWALAVASDA